MTNSGNPVTNLTVDQLRDIYAGRITNWRQVGGPDSPIVAFQRPENSGSQTGILDLVMEGTPMMPAPRTEYVISDMEGTVDAVATYDNSSGALGYSYYYFVTAMYGELARGNTEDGVRLVSVNGVAPREETIRSGDTGDEMAFRDLFVDGASVEGILASAYYEHLHVGGWDGAVIVRIGDHGFNFRLTDYWQSVALFKRFVEADNAALYTAPAVGACPVFHVMSPSGSCMGPGQG